MVCNLQYLFNGQDGKLIIFLNTISHPYFLSAIINVYENFQSGNVHSWMQIENEYQQVEGYYGEKGKSYVSWVANMELSLNTNIPCVMCKQTHVPNCEYKYIYSFVYEDKYGFPRKF